MIPCYSRHIADHCWHGSEDYMRICDSGSFHFACELCVEGWYEDMALRTVILDDGNQMILCPAHRAAAKDHITDEASARGGDWKCRICSITRRLAGQPMSETSKYIGGHMVIRYPNGNFYCDCASWRFQRIPAAERTCRHTELFE